MATSKVKAFVASAVVGLLVVGLPSLSAACSVCTAGRDEENQLAYLLSTFFMSLLPLMAVGTLGFVLWRRIKKLELESQAKDSATN